MKTPRTFGTNKVSDSSYVRNRGHSALCLPGTLPSLCISFSMFTGTIYLADASSFSEEFNRTAAQHGLTVLAWDFLLSMVCPTPAVTVVTIQAAHSKWHFEKIRIIVSNVNRPTSNVHLSIEPTTSGGTWPRTAMRSLTRFRFFRKYSLTSLSLSSLSLCVPRPR